MPSSAVIRFALLSTVLVWTVQPQCFGGLTALEACESSVSETLETQVWGGPLFELSLDDSVDLLAGLTRSAGAHLEVGEYSSVEARLGAILTLRGPPAS